MRGHRDKVEPKMPGNRVQRLIPKPPDGFPPSSQLTQTESARFDDPNNNMIHCHIDKHKLTIKSLKANGINKEKRESWEISQYDIWALNAAYGGPLPPCQRPKKVGWKQREELRGLNCRLGTGNATEGTTTSVADTTAETVVCPGQT